ncbi:non-ribosomal peptide synthetase [Streptomyces kunmingensis]|uniref:Non-ribosomal peptide synthetase n=1 Tax=Streptomyces kunmingensis TaxID=68225 RepID=A0ABU6CN83_9ACTN|nr:non-ribosomal peptide synthetase [Streptomyces kunmingensis]MEB3966190.1 non-ribosomal peptide synthetase [Streptomyces kunmingensis]
MPRSDTGSLCDLFAEHVVRSPDAPAVAYGPTALTYRQLDRVTNSLAARLRELGVQTDRLVAIRAERSVSLVVGMLATVKAGGAYLTLDPALPAARSRTVLEESKPVALLAEAGGEDPSGLGIPVLTVAGHLGDAVWDSAAHDARVDGGATPDDLAYVVYTSGSSGTPKGICVTHFNVAQRTRDVDYLRFDPGDRVAQISNASFDAATIEVWGALLNGAELIGFDRDTILSPGLLARALRERRIDTMVVATPLFNQLAADDPATFATVSQVLVGGDVMGVSQANAVAALPNCTLLNGYGPAECTTLATAHHVTPMPPDQLRVPIGRPISNTTCYVLDEALRPRPAGVPGELYIGGDAVARGYLDRPDLTDERFLPDPFATEPGMRMYATGDQVLQLPDGTLDFLGRTDFQVKVRGFRVETNEVDATLLQHPAVAEAVTVADTDAQTGDKSLVSYYVTTAAGTAPETDDVLSFLRDRLPEYMVPARLIRLPELPKNANMKIDRARLPAPEKPSPVTAGAATGELDDEITALIGQLLNVPHFGREENFFDAGGQSMLAIRLLTQVGRRFDVAMTLAEFFEDPTARGIADHIREARS